MPTDLMAIFRWGRRLPPEALFLLGLERAPCHATHHDFFKALDVAATEAVLGAWVRGAEPKTSKPSSTQTAINLDPLPWARPPLVLTPCRDDP